MPLRGFDQLGSSIFAGLFGHGAAGDERAALWGMQPAWQITLKNDAFAFAAQRWIRHRHRGQ